MHVDRSRQGYLSMLSVDPAHSYLMYIAVALAVSDIRNSRCGEHHSADGHEFYHRPGPE